MATLRISAIPDRVWESHLDACITDEKGCLSSLLTSQLRMKNPPSDFGIKEAMSTLERRPTGLGKVEVRNQEAGLPRKEHMVDIVLFAMVIARGLVSRRQSATGTAKDATRTEGF